MKPLAIVLAGLAALAALAWVLLRDGAEPAGVAGDAPRGPVDEGGETPAAPRLAGQAAPEAPPATPGGALLRGRVLEVGGRPAAGVRVEARRTTKVSPKARFRWSLLLDDGWPEPVPVAAAATAGSDGRFSLGGLAEGGDYEVRAVPEPPRTGSSTSAVATSDGATRVTLLVGEGVPVEGRVVDAADRGVRALVTVTQDARTFDRLGLAVPETSTDPEGRFRLAAAPVGPVDFAVRVPGRAARRNLRLTLPVPGEVVLRLEDPGGVPVAGHVRDTSGAPVEGATVLVQTRDEAVYAGPWSAYGTRTDAAGAFRVENVSGARILGIRVQAPGHLPLLHSFGEERLPPGGILDLELTLSRGAVVEGRVLDEGGLPVSGARVEVAGNPEVEAAVSGASGAYRLTAVPLGMQWLTVRASGLCLVAAGYAPQWAAPPGPAIPVPLDQEGQVVVRNLVLGRGTDVAGRVVDASGNPVTGARVTARRSGPYGRSPEDESVVLADAEGAFRFAGLEAEVPWSLLARTPTHVSETAEVHVAKGGTSEPVVLVVRPAASISGRVLDAEGRPVVGVVVHAEGGVARGEADAEGTFRLEDLPAGTWRLTVTPPDGPAPRGAVGPVAVDVAWGQQVEGVSLSFPTPYEVSGVVVDEPGAPWPGGLVLLRSAEDSGFGYGRVEVDGRFRVGWLARGTYTATVDGAPAEGSVEAGATDARVVVRRSAMAPVAFQGTVLDPAGRPVASGTLTVWIGEAGRRNSGSGLPIRSGRVVGELRLGPGLVDVTVSDATEASGRPLDVRPTRWTDLDPTAPVEIRLEPGLSVEGRVLGPEGPVPGVLVKAEVGRHHAPGDGFLALTAADGTFRIGGLGEGPVQIQGDGGDAWATPSPVQVNAGATDVVIRLVAARTVEGRVENRQGQPVAGAVVEARWEVAAPEGGSRGLTSRATARSDGSFRVSGIGADRVRLSVSGPSGGRDGRPSAFLPVTLSDVAAGSRDHRIVLEEGVFLEGTVQDGAGGPAARANVSLSVLAGGRARRQSSTWSEEGTGVFRLGPLLPGRYTLTVESEGLTSEPVEVTAPAAGVRLTVPRGHVLTGEVVDPPPGGVDVQFLVPGPGRQMRGRSTTSGTAGAFRIVLPDDTPGTLCAMERGGDRYALLEGVRPSASPHRVLLQRGGTIEGRLEIPATDHPPVGIQIAARTPEGFEGRASPAPDGTFALRGLPPGVWRIQAWGNDTAGTWSWNGVVTDVPTGARGVTIPLTGTARRR